jgi:hypothetical protein
MELLKETKSTFHTDALEALAVWYWKIRWKSDEISSLENEKQQVDPLLTTANLTVIKDVLANSPDHNLVSILESTLKILMISSRISKELGAGKFSSKFRI